MRAASRAAGLLLAAVLVSAIALSPAVAGAQAAPDLHCPATVGGLPLSFTTPFSGTVRPVAGQDGELRSASLLCAYGEGVEPSAEVTVTWEPDGDAVPCGRVDTVVAPSVRRQPFARAGGDLLDAIGTRCPDDAAVGFPLGLLALAGGAVALVAGVVVLRRRRRTVVPATVPVAEPEVLDDEPAPAAVEPAAVVPAPVLTVLPRPHPVLASLSGPSGRAFARTGAGQWAAVSAVAYAAGNPVVGDLARAGALVALGGGRRPRADVAVLAGALAHQDGTDDR